MHPDLCCVCTTAESHFATLIRAIVYQQLAGCAAAAIHGRLIAALGGDVIPAPPRSISSHAGAKRIEPPVLTPAAEPALLDAHWISRALGSSYIGPSTSCWRWR